VTECNLRRACTARISTARITAATPTPTPTPAPAHRHRLARAPLGALAALVLAVSATAGLSAAPSARAQPAAGPRAPARTRAGSGPAMGPDAIARRLRLDAWHFALRQRGKPYIRGGVGPRGYDCSGLVWAAYRSVGIILPRTTFEMLDSRALVRISWRQARRGDLVFFGREHVELFRYGYWTLGAAHTGTSVAFHRFNRVWHPTMYFRVR
jgi:cell wall-associated NlpC family hydrolase